MALVPAIPLAIELAEIGITTFETAVPVAEFLEANPWAARLSARALARAASGASRMALRTAQRSAGRLARTAEHNIDRIFGVRNVNAVHRVARNTVGQLSENQVLGLLGAGTAATGGLVAADVHQHGGGRLPNTFPAKKPAKDPTQPPDSGRNRGRDNDDNERNVRPAHSTADDMDDMPGGAAGGDPDGDDDMDDDDDWPYKPAGGGGDTDDDDGASQLARPETDPLSSALATLAAVTSAIAVLLAATHPNCTFTLGDDGLLQQRSSALDGAPRRRGQATRQTALQAHAGTACYSQEGPDRH